MGCKSAKYIAKHGDKDGTVRISVHRIDGTSLELNMGNSCSIHDLKVAIGASWNLPPVQQKLVLNSLVPTDNELLLHLCEGGTFALSMTLVVRMVEPCVLENSGGATAELKDDGSVVTSGNPAAGGNSSKVQDELESGVQAIYSSESAFAALKNDHIIVAWGDQANQAEAVQGALIRCQEKKTVKSIVKNSGGVAALKSDGSVVAWGCQDGGGDCASVMEQLSGNVQSVCSADVAFAALKADGSVVTWGHPQGGGDSTAVQEQLTGSVQSIISTNVAFAVLKVDGSVVAWGPAEGADISSEM
eukprot:gnl/MRDRNA2_/MRDRNA2_70474_c0_seq2.p1 gnl/MRDRNA2_/MRDRNA2_70474_c0~~gnl/MRDRNA2_/MRDRNA2_70474_c0_seq2.p1  ORF type:complete len:302 (+),score=66.12 gnl/MRDRNA2_/MRDRNA2_70474_c0_seq2:83-988(+)